MRCLSCPILSPCRDSCWKSRGPGRAGRHRLFRWPRLGPAWHDHYLMHYGSTFKRMVSRTEIFSLGQVPKTDTAPSIVMAMCLLLVGCATPSIYLVNPNSGEVHECRPSRMYRPSLAGQIVGNSEINDCAKQFEAMGYIKAENLTPAQRAELKPTFKDNTQRVIVDQPSAPIVPPSNPNIRCTSNQIGNSTYTNCN